MPSDPLKNADYPQWQCAVDDKYYGGFKDVPIHCQQKRLMDFDNSLQDLLREEEENPKRINYLTDSPMPDYGMPNSAADNLMVYALRATTKKTGIEGGSSDGCKFDKNGNKTCGVNVPIPPLDMSVIPGFVDASVGGENGILVSFESFADAKTALEEVVKGDCADQLAKLFGNLESKGLISNPIRNANVISLLDDLANKQSEGGVFFNKTHAEAMDEYFKINPGGEPITIPQGMTFAAHIARNSQGTRMPSEKGANMFVYVYATGVNTQYFLSNGRAPQKEINRRIKEARGRLIGVLIHELAHAAGKNRMFSHSEMDAAALAIDPSLSKYNFKSSGNRAEYFNQFVRNHCGLPNF